jgi:simple sugar transport system ATP-binding protein/D-xylose transport system ATP-binding protein
MTATPALELRAVRKSFGPVKALSHVDFAAYPGEVHAIVGDNGAGKSTMIKIVTGISTNMALGNLPYRWGVFLDRKRMDAEAAAALKDLNARVGDVRTPVGLLSGGQRQVVAIARAVRMNKPIILLDEPTAALGVQESAYVGRTLDRLRADGKAVICISHDLEFVFQHSDRITVLRLGKTVGTRTTADVSRDEIIAMITGAAPADTLQEASS